MSRRSAFLICALLSLLATLGLVALLPTIWASPEFWLVLGVAALSGLGSVATCAAYVLGSID